MKRGTSLIAGFSAVLLLAVGVAVAQSVLPSDVQFTEYGGIVAPLSGQPGDATNGAIVMADRGKGNCIACHQVSALSEHPFHGEVGPPLDGAADRWTEADLRGLVANAKMTFDETVMPAFYKTSGFIRPGDGFTGRAAQGEPPPLLTAQEVEDVVAFLLTLSEE